MDENNLTPDEWEEAFKIELEALEILSKKVKSQFKNKRKWNIKISFDNINLGKRACV